MTIKIRDGGGILRTIDSVKIRDGGGILRTITSIKIRGADNVLREVFAAGGTPPASNPVYISPPSNDTQGTTAFATAYFTLTSTGAGPTAYAWGVLDGPGTVISGGSTNSAQLRVAVANVEDVATATFYCDATVAGTVYRATCTMTRYRYGSGGPFA